MLKARDQNGGIAQNKPGGHRFDTNRQGADETDIPLLRRPCRSRQQQSAEEGDPESGGLGASEREAGPPQLHAEPLVQGRVGLRLG